MTITLSVGEYLATKDKIDKINERAAKRGFTGRITLDAKRTETTHTNDLGFQVTTVGYAVDLGGTPPRYGDWTLLATLDWEGESLIVHTAPGVDKIDRTRLRKDWCDHCKTDRYRIGTYLVGNDQDEQVQVGSTCIKDFLGWSAQPVFFSEEGVREDIEEHLSGGSYRDDNYAVETIVAAAWAAVQAYGYMPASSYEASTKATVLTILDPHSKWDREEAAKLRPFLDKSYPQAKIILDWVLGDEFSGDSEFVRNLKALAASEFVSSRSVGYLASTPQVWAKAQERDLIRRQAEDELNNEWVGELKQRLELVVKIKSIRYIEGDFGTTTLYTLTDPEGHVYKWFSSNAALGETADDRQYLIKGTVKKHDEYQGARQTQLTRCTLLKEITP